MILFGKHPDYNKLLSTENHRIGRCKFRYAFSEGDCSCFVDPSPPPWEPELEYHLFDCVSHNGERWYSVFDGPNIGIEPEPYIPEWRKYSYPIINCENEDWDSFPPYGGIGKTPDKYIISIKFYYEQYFIALYAPWVSDPELRCQPESYYFTSYVVNFNIIVTHSSTTPCYWFGGIDDNEIPVHSIDWHHIVGAYSPMPPWDCDVIFPLLSGSANLYLCVGTEQHSELRILLRLSQVSTNCLPTTSREFGHTFDIEQCEIVGTRTFNSYRELMHDACGVPVGHELTDYIVSWRPLDCDYERWDETKSYAIGDCVTWNGKFYRSCVSQNLGNEPEEDASNICELGFFWRLV